MDKLIIEVTLEELMKNSEIDLYDMYGRDDFIEYLRDTSIWDYHYMDELDNALSYESPSSIAAMVCESPHFDVNDEVFYFDGYNGIHSIKMTQHDEIIANTLEYEDFLDWAVWGGPGDERYLDALMEEYGEKHFGEKANAIELRIKLD